MTGLMAIAVIMPVMIAGTYALAVPPMTRPGRELTIRGTVPAGWPVDKDAWFAVPMPVGPERTMGAIATIRLEGSEMETRATGQYLPCPPPQQGGTAWIRNRFGREAAGRQVTLRIEFQNLSHQQTCLSRYDDPCLSMTDPSGRLILRYLHGPPPADFKWPVTDLIHPLVGLDGEEISAFGPDDHPHHRGIFWGWVRYEQEGRSLGSWWIPEGITCEPGPIVSDDGPFISSFRARHWLVHVPEPGRPGRRFIEEDVLCRVFPATDTGRAVDLEISLRALVPGVRIGGQTALDKGYGGLTARFAEAEDIRIVMDGKFTPEDVIAGRARWADWSGRFTLPGGQRNDRPSGLTVMIHPSHPDYPPKWLTRYYGVLCVGYPGVEMADVGQETPLRLRYRLWVHRGRAENGDIEDQYLVFAADWQWRIEP